MIIQLKPDCEDKLKNAVVKKVRSLECKVNEVTTVSNHYLVCVGKKEFDIRAIGNLPGVQDVHRVEDMNKLVSRQWRVHPTIIDLGNDIQIEQGKFSIIAGPCSIESEEQVKQTLDFLLQNNVKLMRGTLAPRRSMR